MEKVEYFLLMPYWHLDSRTYQGRSFAPDIKIEIKDGEVKFPEPNLVFPKQEDQKEVFSGTHAKFLSAVFADMAPRLWDKIPAWSRGAGQPARATESWQVGHDVVAISQDGEILSVLRVRLESGKPLSEKGVEQSIPVVIPTPNTGQGEGWHHLLTVGDNISRIREIYEREYAKLEE